MRLGDLLTGLLGTTVAETTIEAHSFTPASTAQTDQLAAQALQNVRYDASTTYGASNGTCTLHNAYVRREWTAFSGREKRQYIDAVLCLQKKPPISGDLVPGARSRYDDFVGTHINQTGTIHATGNFLSWHRYFTWTYEQALRNECNYKGYQPYLNWQRYALDLYNAPVFDGSSISMSGNGAPDPTNNGTSIPSNSQKDMILPPGHGGGCVTSGPFANMTVHLGPISPALNTIKPNPLTSGLGYNPRCLRRDISAYAASHWSTDANITSLLTQSPNISTFQTTLQGDFPAGFLGAHTAGHFFVGGDPGGDLFTSPGDPYFFLQHAQIDRTWWIWQNYPDDCEERKRRMLEISGTLTTFNTPPTRNATLEDVIELGVNTPGGGIRIKDAVDTMSGTPFCYYYV